MSASEHQSVIMPSGAPIPVIVIRSPHPGPSVVVTANMDVTSYSSLSLGADRPNGGLVEHRKNRMDVSGNLRKVAFLIAVRTSFWKVFKET